MKFLAVLVTLAALSACSAPAPKFDVLGNIPRFQLISQNGQPFDSSVLAGKIWVADFFYTSCPGPCPRMTSQMHDVQKAVENLPNVRFVSFSIDPKTDTPATLASYAKEHGAAPGWFFLTGPVPTLNMLDFNAFKLGKIDGTMQHSTRFVLVDGKGQIRAYYDTSEPTAVQKVISDVRALAREERA